MPKLIENYRDNLELRQSFFTLVKSVFGGMDFEPWYNKGFWMDDYIPFSFYLDDKIIANVSISKMNLILNNQLQKGIQFGTVGTLEDYQGRGYSRQLMEYVINKYSDQTDLFFLFANESVVDFYPKFEFRHQKEYLFKRTTEIPKANSMLQNLNLFDVNDLTLLKRLVRDRLPITHRFGAQNYGFITFWHMLNIYPKNIFYLADDEVAAIITIENNELHIWDLIFSKIPDMEKLLPKLIVNNHCRSVVYHFPPDQLSYKSNIEMVDPHSLLFIRSKSFPKHLPVKFPITAQT